MQKYLHSGTYRQAGYATAYCNVFQFSFSISLAHYFQTVVNHLVVADSACSFLISNICKPSDKALSLYADISRKPVVLSRGLIANFALAKCFTLFFFRLWKSLLNILRGFSIYQTRYEHWFLM